MSPETDILIVAYNQERFATEIRTAFRHWQVYSASNPFTLEGRRFRRAYFTRPAAMHDRWPMVESILRRNALKTPDAEVLSFEEHYEPPICPDPQTFDDAVLVSELHRARHPYS